MLKKLRVVLKGKSGVSFPLVIGATLSLLLILCGIGEYFRLQIVAAGIRDTVEDTIIFTINDNYARVHHGVREGYSDRYMPYGEGEWGETLGEGDIYTGIDEVLGARKNGGRHMKFAGDSGDVVESFSMGLNATLRNTPLAPSDPGSAQHFKAEAVIRLEVPIRFGGKLLSSMYITLRVQISYIEIL